MILMCLHFSSRLPVIDLRRTTYLRRTTVTVARVCVRVHDDEGRDERDKCLLGVTYWITD
jgi:hypothetical protein